MRRRRVTLHLEDITDRAAAWAALPRAEFNGRLEEWFAGGGRGLET